MNPFAVILSAFLSLLVAMPLCCCSAKAGDTNEVAGCCHAEQESDGSEHNPKLCACKSHDAQDKAEKVRLPANGVTHIIAPDAELHFAPLLVGTTMISLASPWIIDDPLSDICARYSRWII